MKKLILSFVIIGVVWAILIVIFSLISMVVDSRLASVFLGAIGATFGTMAAMLSTKYNYKISSARIVFLELIAFGTMVVSVMLFRLVWGSPATEFSLSFGWMMLGVLLYCIVAITSYRLWVWRNARLARAH